MTEFNKGTKERLKEFFAEQVEDVEEGDIRDALNKGRTKIDSVAEKVPEVMKDVWVDLCDMWGLLNDYYHHRYTDIPWGSMAAIVVALLYFVSPLDFIPDVIPVIGLVDDAFMLGLVVKFIGDDLDKYRRWRDGKPPIAASI